MNIKEIPDNDCPLIVLSDKTSGWYESLIKVWTKANYNHAMWMKRPGYFSSQGNTYSEAPVERYMGKNYRLKFWKVKGLTVVQKKYIIASINRKLALPWYKKMYDWLGIVGQTIKLKFISTPGLDYCSEDVPRHLYDIIPFVSDEFAVVLRNIPRHASPKDLNEYFKKHTEHFEVYGKWEHDDT